MSSLTQIADGLAEILKAIPAFEDNVYTVVRRPATYPAAILIPPAIPNYGTSLSGVGGQLLVTVMVLVGTADVDQQASLWPFLDWTGPSSIPAAIDAQRGLGLTDVDVRVRSAEPPGLIELPDGTVAYGVQLNVGIFAS